MRYGKRWIFLLTGALLLTVMLIWQLEPEVQVQAEKTAAPIQVRVSTDGRTEQISCWDDGEGRYYLFLPSFAELSQTELWLEPETEGSVNGQELISGQTCGSFSLGRDYALEYTRDGETHQGTLVFLRSSQIPSMHIRVQSGNMDYIHKEKGNKESGSLHIYNADGSVSFVGNLNSISGRGQGSWVMEKKPYNLTLAGESDLLGMGTAQRWILLANHSDDSHLRNKLVYDYAAEVGMSYSPESQWVDLYLNGEYAGLYQLSERNEIHPQRVVLEENSSFLVSMEWSWRLEGQDNPFFQLDSGFSLRIHHSAIGEEELEQLWQSAENAILAEDGIDPVTGKYWTKLIDMDSWARKYLIEEIFGNLDAGAVSQFYYGNTEDGKIFAGPVWDYDLAMGNTDLWQLSQPECFCANRPMVSAWLQNSWFYPLYQKEEFYDRVVELYREEYRPLLETYLTENLAQYARTVLDAGLMNQYRWHTKAVAEESAYLSDYMMQRMAFLDSLWLEGEIWYTVLVDPRDGGNTACYAVRLGEPMPELPDISRYGNAVGWYHRGTEEPVDLEQPVNGNLDIYLKYQKAESSSADDKETSSNLIPLLSRVPGIVLVLVFLTIAAWDIFRQLKFAGRKKTEKEKIP